MTKEESKELYSKALDAWGFPAQAMMVLEECGELINAICKYDRGRANEDDIITEIADVMIMCEQMASFFGTVKVEIEKDRKLNRLKERLAKYE